MIEPVALAVSINNSRERWEAYRKGLPVPARTGKEPQLSEEEYERFSDAFAEAVAKWYRQELAKGYRQEKEGALL